MALGHQWVSINKSNPYLCDDPSTYRTKAIASSRHLRFAEDVIPERNLAPPTAGSKADLFGGERNQGVVFAPVLALLLARVFRTGAAGVDHRGHRQIERLGDITPASASARSLRASSCLETRLGRPRGSPGILVDGISGIKTPAEGDALGRPRRNAARPSRII